MALPTGRQAANSTLKNLFSRYKKLYFITDSTVSDLGNIETVKISLNAGVRMIQLREKNYPKKKLFEEAVSLKKLAQRYGATLIINDHIDIALAADADGVHLGHEDMPLNEARTILGKNRIIGISTHSLKQAIDAQRAGADYIGFGPVFKTITKDAGKPKGINSLKKIKQHIKIPVVAIGGITPETAPDVLGAGADALAVASAILSGDIKENTERLLSVICRIKR